MIASLRTITQEIIIEKITHEEVYKALYKEHKAHKISLGYNEELASSLANIFAVQNTKEEYYYLQQRNTCLTCE